VISAVNFMNVQSLFDRYHLLGIDNHKMSCVHAPAEAIPLDDVMLCRCSRWIAECETGNKSGFYVSPHPLQWAKSSGRI
jgi:hypothetical protein